MTAERQFDAVGVVAERGDERRSTPCRTSPADGRCRAWWTACKTSTGEVELRAAARTVWRARPVSAAASMPLPHTSPIARPQRWSSTAEEIVEVAADQVC